MVNCIPLKRNVFTDIRFTSTSCKAYKDRTYYIGQTKNLEIRLRRHNLGHGRYTKPRIPYKIMRSEIFKTRLEVVRREREIKSYKGGAMFRNLVS